MDIENICLYLPLNGITLNLTADCQYIKNRDTSASVSYVGERIRTPDLLVRSQTLYPAELRPHIVLCFSQQNLL